MTRARWLAFPAALLAIVAVWFVFLHGHAPQPAPEHRHDVAAWTWRDVAGTVCRDGSPSGIAISVGTSPSLVVFLEGGGVCINAETCGKSPAHAGASDFTAPVSSGIFESGIFDRSDPRNPLATWNFAYVPYCTGDFAVGGAVSTVAGAPQHFAGYANLGLDLAAISQAFATPDRVLLAGSSAGGFAAALNYPRVVAAFGGAPVTLLDDSGPLFSLAWFASCEQDALRSTWGLDGTVGPTPLPQLAVAYVHGAGFGFVDSAGDHVISGFYGWGSNGCAALASNVLSPIAPARFSAGLRDLQSRAPDLAMYVFQGEQHTSLGSAKFYEREAGGVALSAWVASLLAGQGGSVGL